MPVVHAKHETPAVSTFRRTAPRRNPEHAVFLAERGLMVARGFQHSENREWERLGGFLVKAAEEGFQTSTALAPVEPLAGDVGSGFYSGAGRRPFHRDHQTTFER